MEMLFSLSSVCVGVCFRKGVGTELGRRNAASFNLI